MKIGIFTDTYTPDINGVVTSVVALENELRKNGHEVYIICPHKGFLKAKREGNVFRIPGIELKQLYGYILSKPYDNEVKKEIEKLNLDVIHVQQEFSVGIFGRLLGRSLGIPVVYTYHTMYEDYTNYINIFNLDSLEAISKKIFEQFSSFMCESVQCIIAPSKKTKDKLIEYRIKRPIYVIPTGLDLHKFKYENVNKEMVESLRSKLGLYEDEKVIIYVGRLAPEKSMDIVVEGFKHVKNEKVKLIIVGAGPSLDTLKKLAADLEISHKVIFTGKVPAEEVPAYYQLGDAFVSASLSETQGLTFIEALAASLPIFARPDDVLDELVYDQKTGFYFNSGEEFAAKVDEFVQMDQNEYEKMRSNCLDVVQKYDVHKFGRDVLSVYNEAIENYQECFKINQIRSSDNCMRLYLENKKNNIEDTLLVTLDDYMLYELKKDGLLEFVTYESLKEKEKLIKAYRMCLRKLRAKDRTRKEMYDLLINQDEVLDIKYINDIIDELENKGYINDDSYTMIACDKLDNSLFGKRKIIQKLEEKGIPREKTIKYLSVSDDDHEKEKCMKKALKYHDTIKNKSVKEKQMLIKQKLKNDGFSFEIIDEAIDNLNFEDDIMKEAVVLDATIDKIMKSYSKKYSGKDLENRIIKYGLRKGFMYDDIKHALEMRGINEA